MEFVNQEAFNRFGTKLAAKGISGAPNTRLEFRGDRPITQSNGGILGPKKVELPVGTRLIRFGDGSLVARALDGAWWLHWNEHSRVAALADRRAMSLSEAVARTCVVPLEWSDLSTQIQIRLKAPLLAYAGPGAPAETRSMGRMEPLTDGIGVVNQLYIPGLGDPDLRRIAIIWEGHGYHQSRMLR